MKNVLVCSGGMVGVEGVPEEVKILPLGLVKTQKGDFVVDDDSVRMIIEHFKDRRLDLVIDYEHQTLKDIQAPAGGWITEIHKGEDAVIAKVKWTDKAAEYLKNREYRYLSPVVMIGKKDRKAREIHSVALTNTPAIDGMFALVNSMDIADYDDEEEDTKMELNELAKMLGLPETATEEEIRSAIGAAGKALQEKAKDGDVEAPPKKEGCETVANSSKVMDPVILSLLGLKSDAKTEDVAASIMKLRTGGPDAMELTALKQELEKRNAQDMVQMALKEGKITAAQKEWAEAYALSDSDGFKSFVEKAPVVVPQGKMELKDAPHETKTDFYMEILKNCGLTKEDAEKYYRED